MIKLFIVIKIKVKENATLVFSFVGYATIEKSTANSTSIDVALADGEELKEVQVQLSENDWICDDCKTINKFDKADRKSRFCKQCKHKNNAVAMMIAQQNSKEHVN